MSLIARGPAERRAIRVHLAVLFAMVLLADVLLANAPVTARITGRVVDQTGAALPGVTVTLVAGGTTAVTATDRAGSYRLDGPAPGRAELTFRLINFTVVRRVVELAAHPVSVDATMWLALNADVVVTGERTFRNLADAEAPAESLVGIAASASEGAITAAQIARRPSMRSGEVLESVPGMVISQHSGEGKASQYYLRGFNLDHGTDFATTVAGVPVNMPTGAHAHGYSDLGFLIPELVSGVQFRKGPYFADEGDFSAAGAAAINYVTELDQPLVAASAGNGGWARWLAAASPRVAAGHLLAAVDVNRDDGPWVQPGDYRKINGLIRYSHGDSRSGYSVTGMSYHAEWDASDQIPDRAVSQGLVSRFGVIDPSDGGRASRQSVVAEFQRTAGGSSVLASGYVLRNSLNLFSNFTYFLDDPVRGDQFEQSERRIVAGGRLTYRRLGRLFDRHAQTAAGVQLRRDWLEPVGLYHTERRLRLSTTREDRLGQTMAGAFAQTEVEWTRTLRTTVGLRLDAYQFAVTSLNPLNSGDGVSAIVSPKFGAVFGPWAGTELYANAGVGFHSNDARGVVTRVEPRAGYASDRVTPLVRARGAEIGLRTIRLRGLQSTVALWYLGLDSEQVFVGDAGTTEPGRPSVRAGVEWTNYARVAPWLTLDLDLALSRARFDDAGGPGVFVPGALGRVVAGGVSVESRQPLFGSVRVRHFGPRPLVEDASVRSDSTTLISGEVGCKVSSRARVTLDVFNVLDANVSDIDYYYVSRLPGEPAEGVDDVHAHPALPRSFRLALRVAF